MDPEAIPPPMTAAEREIMEAWGRITADAIYQQILEQFSEPQPDVVLEARQVTIPPGALEFLGAEEVKLDGKPTGEVSYSFLLRG